MISLFVNNFSKIIGEKIAIRSYPVSKHRAFFLKMTLSSELTFTKDISLSRRAKPSSASKTVATKVKLVAKKVKFVATKIKSIATKVKFVAMLRGFFCI